MAMRDGRVDACSMSRLKRIARGSALSPPSAVATHDVDELVEGATDDARAVIAPSILVGPTGIRVDPQDPANVQRSKLYAGWWLPEDVTSWSEIPEPEQGEPIKERPLTVQELMRREREFHLYGRGAGGKHVPDHAPRLLGFIIDVLIYFVVIVGYKLLVGYPFVGDPLRPAPALVGVLVAVHIFPIVMWRASFGKLVFGLRLVRVDGSECSVLRALARSVVPPLAVLDAFLVVVTSHRRRLVDYALGTRVVANG